MFYTQNGWTKKGMKDRINAYTNEQCETDWGSCRYKINDNRCAVGRFIPDNHPGLHYVGTYSKLILEY